MGFSQEDESEKPEAAWENPVLVIVRGIKYNESYKMLTGGICMGSYLNPGNEAFAVALNSEIYVDKTGLSEHLNKKISTEEKCIALSHARRFGKSHAAGMIDAYYSLGCDSTKLFEDTTIAESSDFKKYMNKYNVIHLDISSVWDFHKEDLVESIHERVCEDFQKEYEDTLNYDKDLYLLIHPLA